MLFALLGGLILNLMPCVFPILSMKALGLVKMAEKSAAATRLHGIAYTLGILLCFAALALLLISFKAAGAQIGWGFQLQNPLVVLLLAYLLFVIGLNLSGLFEVGGGFMNFGAKLSGKEGPAGSFMTGILAAIVATPCTAPFMGVAMGYALTQSTGVALLIFLMLGFGLALPYLALSFFPALRSTLPKPGPWMAAFRELLAFPIYASAAWLVWVFSQQVNDLGLLYALTGFVGIALAVWLLRHNPQHKMLLQTLRILCLLATAAVLFLAFEASMQVMDSPPEAQTSPAVPTQTADAQPFTPENYSAAIAADMPVFVNMTAAWCITCKVNEKVALNIPETKALFEKHNVRYLKGDWTNQDPEITKYLSRYGRNGVPIYVYYGPRDAATGHRPQPVVLPQLLTPGTLAGLFEQTE